MIDLVLLIIVALITWLVATEGLWGSVLTFFCVVISGLLAMNFFEPLASLLDAQIPAWKGMFDYIALVGLFAGFTVGLRELCAYMSPVSIEVWPALYQGGRWAFAAATGYVTMAILLTALHTSMLPRAFLGFSPERRNFFEITAPDRQWLAFTQHATGDLFYRNVVIQHSTATTRWKDTTQRLFDGMRIPKAEKQEAEFFPTFLIRYASRRERKRVTNTSSLSGGGAPAAAPAAPSTGGGTAPASVNPSQGF
ncbi:MAG: CvpA family protein [Planctomycetales bacterium]